MKIKPFFKLFIGCVTMQFFVLLFSNSVSANTIADSLAAVWKNTNQHDSIRFKAIEKLVWDIWLYANPDSARNWAEDHLRYAKKTGNKPQIAIALNGIAGSYKLQGNLNAALDEYNKAFWIQQVIGDSKGMAKNLIGMGNIYRDLGNYPLALKVYHKALLRYEQEKDENGKAAVYSSMAVVYSIIGNTEKALSYYQYSLNIRRKAGNERGIATTLTNLGILYRDLKEYNKALEAFDEAVDIQNKLGDIRGIASNLMNVATVYDNQNENQKAIQVHLEAIEIWKAMVSDQGLARSYNGIGYNYNKLDEPRKAIDYCLKALGISEKIGDLIEQKMACDCLFKGNKETGDFKNALRYYELKSQLNDSLYDEETSNKIVRLEMNYAFEKKRAEEQLIHQQEKLLAKNELERQKNLKNTAIAGISVVIVFLLVVLSQRNRISKEKKRSEELLLNILPSEIAEELKENGKSIAKRIDEVSVLFTDFKGFTAISESLSAEDLVADLNICFTAFDEICAKYGIEKIKTIGDSYMAASGLPTVTDDHALKLVSAAIEMAIFIEDGKNRKIQAQKPYFEVRIGIHSGPVVAGIVGVKKFQYDIWGDTVNTASRMESSGEIGKINISDSTYHLVKDKFVCEFRGEIEAKGKGKMNMWSIDPANFRNTMNAIR